ncbi:unnamed protein product [Brassica rapa subsp. narinosa]
MTPSAEQDDVDGLVARDRRDELRLRRESSRQWLEIVMGEKPPSLVATSCSRR